MIPGLAPEVLLGLGCCALALLLGLLAVLEPGRVRLPAGRRRPSTADGSGLFARSTSRLTTRVEAVLRGRDLTVHTAVLDRAGSRTPLSSFVVLITGGALVAGVVGLLLGGPALGSLLSLAVPVGVRVVMGVRAARRRRAFGDQLDDTLQLLASSLRAGHSLTQALATVARDAEEPTRQEFTRVINEARVGRDLGVALDEIGDRMANPDFTWVCQAVAINREVGGNLAEVLDRVSVTIREREQLRRQVSALSAEGRLSANVLIALPLAATAFLLVVNPSYIARFTQSALGYGLIGLSVLMLLVGWLWMRSITRFTI